MASDSQFHCFARLPRELQVMIWEIARPSHRHVLRLVTDDSSRLGFRIYDCIDATSRSRVPRLAWKNDPDVEDHIDPADGLSAEKARLTGRIFTPSSPHRTGIHQSINLDDCVMQNYPTFAYMNFQHDVFTFGQDGAAFHHLPMKHKGNYLRFLRSNYPNSRHPMGVEPHWFFKVEKLALIWEPNSYLSSYHSLEKLDTFDRSILRRADALKLIYVVVKQCNCFHDRGGQLKVEWNDDGFALVDDYINARFPQPSEDATRCTCNLVGRSDNVLNRELSDLFSDRASPPRIETVVERTFRRE
ncbi:hypothetical protein BJ170DRAFT_683503 [Xylariales sp. AK1849]|nr:hypothetical protein BJ170DRAFT_683503 [Xylariales sp. AK1849]